MNSLTTETSKHVLVFYQSVKMYLCLCDWGSSNQLPQLASQAAVKTQVSISMGGSHLHNTTGLFCLYHITLAHQIHFHFLVLDFFFLQTTYST